MFPVVADAVSHILEATIRHVAKPTRRVALALHLITLAVRHRLTLTLAKLTQHLKVNTVIAEFLFHKSVVSFRNMLPSFPCPTCGCGEDGIIVVLYRF